MGKEEPAETCRRKGTSVSWRRERVFGAIHKALYANARRHRLLCLWTPAHKARPLNGKTRMFVLGDWIWQFTYLVFDGEHTFLEDYVEGESVL